MFINLSFVLLQQLQIERQQEEESIFISSAEAPGQVGSELEEEDRDQFQTPVQATQRRGSSTGKWTKATKRLQMELKFSSAISNDIASQKARGPIHGDDIKQRKMIAGGEVSPGHRLEASLRGSFLCTVGHVSR